MLCRGARAGHPTPRPATGNTCCGKPEQRRDLGRTIADHADRARAEPLRLGGEHERRQRDPGIDRRVEERIEVIVRERLAAPFVPQPLAAVVAAEDQQHRRILEPRLPDRPLGERRQDVAA